MSKVKRSTFQKVVEENKRLLSDIKLLSVEGLSAERIMCIAKWRAKFRKDEEFNNQLKEVLNKYFVTDKK